MAAHTLTSAVAPTDIYGGDEVQAFILDPGFNYTRAGFAGEDTPKMIEPSFYAHVPDAEGPQDLFGERYLVPRANLEVKNYMSRDSIVQDWEAAPRYWETLMRQSLLPPRQASPAANNLNNEPHVDEQGDVDMEEDEAAAKQAKAEEAVENEEKFLHENPLLMTEAPWNTAKHREKTIEIAMESWSTPAFWMARTPSLIAFAAGKPTALVIDVGASSIMVAAVHDGLMLKRSIQRSPAGGLWLSNQLRGYWSLNNPPIMPVPWCKVEKKTPVDAGAPPQYVPREYGFPLSESFLEYEMERLCTSFKESVVEMWRGPGRPLDPDMDQVMQNSSPGRVFEFPDGSNHLWRGNRFLAPEGIWNNAAQLPSTRSRWRIEPHHTLPMLINNCLTNVDADLRPTMLANIVVSGGGSLINGFTDRLNMELAHMYPGVRVKIHAAGFTSERRFGAWVGGSILASLGTFHQMWISAKEYEENGPNIVEKRCK